MWKLQNHDRKGENEAGQKAEPLLQLIESGSQRITFWGEFYAV